MDRTALVRRQDFTMSLTIEERLARLERSNRSYKSALIGCLALFSGLILTGFGQERQAYPQHIVAESVTVKTLSAYNGNVNQLASQNGTFQFLSTIDGRADALSIKDGSVTNLKSQRAVLVRAVTSQLEVANQGNAVGINLSADNAGGSLRIYDGQGAETVVLESSGSGGALALFGPKNFVGFEAKVDSRSGYLKLSGPNKSLVKMGRGDRGDGEVTVCTRDGNNAVIASCNPDGTAGNVMVQRVGAYPLVELDSDAKGGFVRSYDGKDERERWPKSAQR